MDTPAPRLYQLCSSHAPICPRCAQVLMRRQHVGLGSTWLQCPHDIEAAVPGAGGHIVRRQIRCGQHVHVLGAPEGVCLVAPITRTEFEAFSRQARETSITAHAVYVALGILG